MAGRVGKSEKLYVSIPELKKLSPAQQRSVFWARVEEAQKRSGERLLAFAQRAGTPTLHFL